MQKTENISFVQNENGELELLLGSFSTLEALIRNECMRLISINNYIYIFLFFFEYQLLCYLESINNSVAKW